MYENNKKEVSVESADDAIARGMKVLKYEEGKIDKRQLKKDKEKSGKVDVKLLLDKCNSKQRAQLLKIVKEQGLPTDDLTN